MCKREYRIVDGKPAAMVFSLSGGVPVPAPSGPLLPSPGGLRALPSDGQHFVIQDADGGNTRELWQAAPGNSMKQARRSPNGKQVAFLSGKTDRLGHFATMLELVEIANGQKNVLIPAEKDLDVGSIIWPTQNRMIVAIDEDLGAYQYNSNLWEIRLHDDGTMAPGGMRRLTSWTNFPIRRGSLSTDGKRLVFIRSFQQRDVYIAPLEAGGTRMGMPRRLTLDLGDDYPTDWTRDSKTIIFTSSRNGPQTIFRQDLDKQTPDQIVVMPRNPDSQQAARLTPDGNSVLFWNWDPVNKVEQLMRVPIGGGIPKAVPNTENVGDNYRCSPAGVCLMAQAQGSGQEFIVSELDPVKGKGREIYRDKKVEHLWLSPEGKWIADTSGSGPETKIILRSFLTGDVVREIPVRGVLGMVSLRYAEDGNGFFVGDRFRDEARVLYVDLSGNSTVLWRQPRSNFSIWAAPSPDGKYLALGMATDDANVYMIKDF